MVCSTTGYINLVFDFVRENLKYLNFQENMGIRVLSRLLKYHRTREVVDLKRNGAMASFLSTATFSCTSIEHTDDAAEAQIVENNEGHLFEY